MKSAQILLSRFIPSRIASVSLQSTILCRSFSKNLIRLNPPRLEDQNFLRIQRTILRTMATENSSLDLIVEHDASAKKFFIQLGNDEAKLEYAQNGDILNMWHTEVPPALQGKGIAKVLAQGAFDYAVKNNQKMILTCSYLQKFYKDNPKDEYKKLVV